MRNCPKPRRPRDERERQQEQAPRVPNEQRRQRVPVPAEKAEEWVRQQHQERDLPLDTSEDVEVLVVPVDLQQLGEVPVRHANVRQPQQP